MRKLSLGLLMLFVFTVPWQNATGSVTNILWAMALLSTLATCSYGAQDCPTPHPFLCCRGFHCLATRDVLLEH